MLRKLSRHNSPTDHTHRARHRNIRSSVSSDPDAPNGSRNKHACGRGVDGLKMPFFEATPSHELLATQLLVHRILNMTDTKLKDIAIVGVCPIHISSLSLSTKCETGQQQNRNGDAEIPLPTQLAHQHHHHHSRCFHRYVSLFAADLCKEGLL